MHKLYELKDKLIDELEEYADGKRITAEDAENIKRLSASVDHICNICDHDDDMSYDDGMGGVNYRYSRENRGGNRGGRYSNRDMAYARGRMNAPRDSMGRYSGADGDMETIKADVMELAEKVKQM